MRRRLDRRPDRQVGTAAPQYCARRLPHHPSASRQPHPVLSRPRYPIHTPREACYGDMNGFPGVRNYGVVDPEDMYDVYCYAEDLPGACSAAGPVLPSPAFAAALTRPLTRPETAALNRGRWLQTP